MIDQHGRGANFTHDAPSPTRLLHDGNTWRQLQAAHPGIRIELTSTCSEGFSPVAALHRKDDEPRGRDMTDSLGAQGDALQRSGLLEQGVGAFGGGA